MVSKEQYLYTHTSHEHSMLPITLMTGCRWMEIWNL